MLVRSVTEEGTAVTAGFLYTIDTKIGCKPE